MLRSLAYLALAPFLLIACSGSDNGGGSTTFNAQQHVGTWTGTWTNTTFSSTGAVTATVTLNGSTYTITFDMGGNVFGGADPAPEGFSATVTTTNATLTGITSPVYGTLTGSLDANGNVTASGTNITGQVSSFTLTGTWNATTINAAVVITFDNQTTANGVATLTKQ